MDLQNELAIIGAGGFAREVAAWAKLVYNVTFYVDDQYASGDIRPLSSFDPNKSYAVIAIGDPNIRKSIAQRMPEETQFVTLIYPSVQMLDEMYIGEGSIICAGSILTTNIEIGKHSHLNLNTTVGHDCKLGDYFTTAPAVNISGNVTTGECVYIGTNAAIRQKVNITSDVTVGMGAIVLNDINQSGTYKGLVK